MSNNTRKTYLVTGSSRGIGFQLVKQLSEIDTSNIIIATARDITSSAELKNLASIKENIHLVQLDVSSADSIAALDAEISTIAQDGIDVFVSNAAIGTTFQTILKTNRESWFKHFETNTVGPIEITKVLYPYLLKKDTRQLIYISSAAGSLGAFVPFSTAAYGQSKAALSHSILTLAFELKGEGFTTIAVHPGTVSTDSGKYGMKHVSPELAVEVSKRIISPEQSADHLIHEVFKKLTKDSNGKFFNYDGSEIPW